ncbi:MAG: hypothetical protein Q8J76_10040, partial [Desulfobulbaceae bacterium]|nr:hypothetical protein [Desulfobulbaceae bacterium]
KKLSSNNYNIGREQRPWIRRCKIKFQYPNRSSINRMNNPPSTFLFFLRGARENPHTVVFSLIISASASLENLLNLLNLQNF